MRNYDMYDYLPSTIIGFHGCDRSTYEDVLYREKMLNPSENKYDWLGNGIYFWEQNYERAWEWATNNQKIQQPAVIGAVLNLGYCCNLLDSKFIKMLQEEYFNLVELNELIGLEMPVNKNVGKNTDLLLRDLDCAVIESLHISRKMSKQTPFDSVRGVFWEGEEIYPTSGFRQQNHIQLCIINPNCIKGFFAPRDTDNNWRKI